MLESFTQTIQNFRGCYPDFKGETYQRESPCGICGSRNGEQLAKADFWDLQQVNLVKCLECGSMQVDPPLTPKSVEMGCTALYRHQHQGETLKSRKRGFYRAFRKGVAFGLSLKWMGLHPRRSLEVGSGDGYFLKGVQYIFPDTKCACLDIVSEILDATSQVHGFESICGTVEDYDFSRHERFDLIIARDILEHVNEPGKVLKNLTQALSSGGHLYFITPNGRQDGWQLYSRWQHDHVPGELLINHVNYFDPEALKVALEKLGMSIRKFYIYDLKQFLRGAGWKMLESHMARRSVRRSASATIASTPSLESSFREAIDIQPIPGVYKFGLLKPFLALYCWLKHTPLVRVNPAAGVGEEIFCLARKT